MSACRAAEWSLGSEGLAMSLAAFCRGGAWNQPASGSNQAIGASASGDADRRAEGIKRLAPDQSVSAVRYRSTRAPLRTVSPGARVTARSPGSVGRREHDQLLESRPVGWRLWWLGAGGPVRRGSPRFVR